MRVHHFAIAAAVILAAALPARAAGPVPSGSGGAVDPKTQCVDGGMPYRIGTHLCGAAGIVRICLRPEQSYGVKGIFVPKPGDKNALHFDTAHWVSTTSARCREGEGGKVYMTTDPRR